MCADTKLYMASWDTTTPSLFIGSEEPSEASKKPAAPIEEPQELQLEPQEPQSEPSSQSELLTLYDMNTFEAVTHIISTQLEIIPESCNPNSHFVNDLGADSLGLVCITLALESFFDIDISEDDADKIQTIQDAVNYISKKTQIT